MIRILYTAHLYTFYYTLFMTNYHGMLTHTMQKGILITLEGLDGSGKSTIARALYEHLRTAGYSVVLTKEPGGSSLGKSLRELLQHHTAPVDAQAEFLLFAADRAQHIKEIVAPALRAGSIVISDRMADSSLAYQGYGRGVDRSMITSINTWVMQGIVPDLTLYLEVSVKTALDRIHARGEKLTNFEKERHEFFERIHNGYHAIMSTHAHAATLDAEQSLSTLTPYALDTVMAWIRKQ